MPRLILFRHARAERARAGQKDHERPLTDRGRKDSAAMGKVIAGRGDAPDLVLCSTSKRTRETWEEAQKAFDRKPETRFLGSIYDANDTCAPILRAEGGAARTVVLIGHNPAIHETARELAADLAGRDGRALADGFPKAGLAVFDFDSDWASLGPRQMRLVAFIPPDL